MSIQLTKKSMLRACLTGFLVISTAAAHADPDKATQKEINYLLAQVQNSTCTFERNGSDYKGNAARKHIERKLDYYWDDIVTTEDFIRLAGTKSTFSGRNYTVSCPGHETEPSNQWLLDELLKYRDKHM